MPGSLGGLTGVSCQIDILAINIVALITSSFDWIPLEWRQKVKTIWGLPLMSHRRTLEDAVGGDSAFWIKAFLSSIVVARIVLARLCTFTYMLNVYSILTWSRPILLVPCLVLNFLKDLILEAMVTILGLILSYEERLSMVRITEFIIVKFVSLTGGIVKCYWMFRFFGNLRTVEELREIRRSLLKDGLSGRVLQSQRSNISGKLLVDRDNHCISDTSAGNDLSRKYRHTSLSMVDGAFACRSSLESDLDYRSDIKVSRSLATLRTNGSQESEMDEDADDLLLQKLFDDPDLTLKEKTMTLLGLTREEVAVARARARRELSSPLLSLPGFPISQANTQKSSSTTTKSLPSSLTSNTQSFSTLTLTRVSTEFFSASVSLTCKTTVKVHSEASNDQVSDTASFTVPWKLTEQKDITVHKTTPAEVEEKNSAFNLLNSSKWTTRVLPCAILLRKREEKFRSDALSVIKRKRSANDATIRPPDLPYLAPAGKTACLKGKSSELDQENLTIGSSCGCYSSGRCEWSRERSGRLFCSSPVESGIDRNNSRIYSNVYSNLEYQKSRETNNERKLNISRHLISNMSNMESLPVFSKHQAYTNMEYGLLCTSSLPSTLIFGDGGFPTFIPCSQPMPTIFDVIYSHRRNEFGRFTWINSGQFENTATRRGDAMNVEFTFYDDMGIQATCFRELEGTVCDLTRVATPMIGHLWRRSEMSLKRIFSKVCLDDQHNGTSLSLQHKQNDSGGVPEASTNNEDSSRPTRDDHFLAGTLTHSVSNSSFFDVNACMCCPDEIVDASTDASHHYVNTSVNKPSDDLSNDPFNDCPNESPYNHCNDPPGDPVTHITRDRFSPYSETQPVGDSPCIPMTLGSRMGWGTVPLSSVARSSGFTATGFSTKPPLVYAKGFLTKPPLHAKEMCSDPLASRRSKRESITNLPRVAENTPASAKASTSLGIEDGIHQPRNVVKGDDKEDGIVKIPKNKAIGSMNLKTNSGVTDKAMTNMKEDVMKRIVTEELKVAVIKKDTGANIEGDMIIVDEPRNGIKDHTEEDGIINLRENKFINGENLRMNNVITDQARNNMKDVTERVVTEEFIVQNVEDDPTAGAIIINKPRNDIKHDIEEDGIVNLFENKIIDEESLRANSVIIDESMNNREEDVMKSIISDKFKLENIENDPKAGNENGIFIADKPRNGTKDDVKEDGIVNLVQNRIVDDENLRTDGVIIYELSNNIGERVNESAISKEFKNIDVDTDLTASGIPMIIVPPINRSQLSTPDEMAALRAYNAVTLVADARELREKSKKHRETVAIEEQTILPDASSIIPNRTRNNANSASERFSGRRFKRIDSSCGEINASKPRKETRLEKRNRRIGSTSSFNVNDVATILDLLERYGDRRLIAFLKNIRDARLTMKCPGAKTEASNEKTINSQRVPTGEGTSSSGGPPKFRTCSNSEISEDSISSSECFVTSRPLGTEMITLEMPPRILRTEEDKEDEGENERNREQRLGSEYSGQKVATEPLVDSIIFSMPPTEPIRIVQHNQQGALTSRINMTPEERSEDRRRPFGYQPTALGSLGDIVVFEGGNFRAPRGFFFIPNSKNIQYYGPSGEHDSWEPRQRDIVDNDTIRMVREAFHFRSESIISILRPFSGSFLAPTSRVNTVNTGGEFDCHSVNHVVNHHWIESNRSEEEAAPFENQSSVWVNRPCDMRIVLTTEDDVQMISEENSLISEPQSTGPHRVDSIQFKGDVDEKRFCPATVTNKPLGSIPAVALVLNPTTATTIIRPGTSQGVRECDRITDSTYSCNFEESAAVTKERLNVRNEDSNGLSRACQRNVSILRGIQIADSTSGKIAVDVNEIAEMRNQRMEFSSMHRETYLWREKAPSKVMETRVWKLQPVDVLFALWILLIALDDSPPIPYRQTSEEILGSYPDDAVSTSDKEPQATRRNNFERQEIDLDTWTEVDALNLDDGVSNNQGECSGSYNNGGLSDERRSFLLPATPLFGGAASMSSIAQQFSELQEDEESIEGFQKIYGYESSSGARNSGLSVSRRSSTDLNCDQLDDEKRDDLWKMKGTTKMDAAFSEEVIDNERNKSPSFHSSRYVGGLCTEDIKDLSSSSVRANGKSTIKSAKSINFSPTDSYNSSFSRSEMASENAISVSGGSAIEEFSEDSSTSMTSRT